METKIKSCESISVPEPNNENDKNVKGFFLFFFAKL